MVNDFYRKFKALLLSPLFVFALVTLTLVFFWFRGGSSLGGGEIGSPYYNIGKMFDISAYAWSGILLGMASGLTAAAAPLYWFFTQMQNIGTPGFLIQATFFFICLMLGFLSMYALTRELFPNRKRIVYFSAAIFYLVNPYALVNVWNRFLQNPMLFYVFLPLGLWLYICGLKKRKYSFAVLNMGLTAVFSFAFAGPSQTLMFWGLLFLISIYYFVFFEKDRFVARYFFLNILLWFIFNFFWFSQQLYFRLSPSFKEVSTVFFTESGNLGTFNALSRVLGQISNLLIFQHGTFFRESVDYPYAWPLIYRNPVFLLMQWTVAISVLVISIRKRKEPWVAFLLSLFFLGIFAAKGNSAPLGEIFDFLFKKVSFLEFFRNPFEKTALLLPLSFSPLFGIFVQESLLWLKRKWKSLYLLGAIGIFGYLILFLGFPYWTGLVFTSYNPPANDPKIGYQVEVPDYYKKADDYLSKKEGIFRFITFPLGGEGIFYKWPKGYAGVEQSTILFSTPSISYNTTIPFYHRIAGKLERLFMIYKDFYKLANLLNARYILFRPDFDYKLSGMRNPDTISDILSKKTLEAKSDLKLAAEFAPLKIYEIGQYPTSQKIYPAANIVLTGKERDYEDVFMTSFNNGDILLKRTDFGILEKSGLSERVSASIIHNLAFYEIDPANFPKYTEAPDIFPYVRRLPGDKIFPLVLLKEKIGSLSKTNPQVRTKEEITLLGKRLMEVKKLVDSGKTSLAKESLLRYMNKLPAVMESIDKLAEFKLSTGQVWRQDDMFNTFSSHLHILRQLETGQLNENGFVTEAIKKFKRTVNDYKILPYWDFIETEASRQGGKRVVFQFEIGTDGKYRLVFPKTLSFPQVFEINKKMEVQVDDRLYLVDPLIRDNYLELGEFQLTSGVHEISFGVPPSQNLVNIADLSLDTQNNNLVEIPIDNFDPFLRYEIGFDYFIHYGDGLNIVYTLSTDTPDPKTGKMRYFYSRKLDQDEYSNLEQSFSFVTGPNYFANAAVLKLWVGPWNNCLKLFQEKFSSKCKKLDIYHTFDRPTRITVRDLQAYAKFPAEARLVRENNLEVVTNLPVVEFERINSTKYHTKIIGAQKPFLLVFSELYDAGWKAYLVSKDEKVNEWPLFQSWRRNQILDKNHLLVNGYANAWWVNKTGNFDVVLEYAPQRLLYVGYAVSGASIAVGVGYLLYKLVKRRFS